MNGMFNECFYLCKFSSLKLPSRPTEVQLLVPMGILDLEEMGAGLGTGLIR